MLQACKYALGSAVVTAPPSVLFFDRRLRAPGCPECARFATLDAGQIADVRGRGAACA